MNFPTWLKSNQNGAIGEIRTKSFLMNRFWVMERSVDIHGADFIIQRRLFEKNILDNEPTRFGVVQAKFSQNERTTHKIKEEYVLDNNKKPRTEFFLIIHTGNEEKPRMFLLTAKDIFESFSVNKDHDFVINSKTVLSSSKYQIKNKKRSLDRIENFIQCAEFYKNRLYVFRKISSVNFDFEAILPEYKEEIEHLFGTVPDVFKEQKLKIFGAMLELEEVHELFVNFLESIDPVEACYVSEKIEHQFGASISLPEVFDADFYHGAKNHKEMVVNMRNDGALDNYISAKKSITDEINLFLQDQSNDTIDNRTIYEISVEYDPDNLRFIRILNSLSQIPEKEVYSEFSKFLEAKEGRIVLSWKVGLQFKHDGYVTMNDCCINDMMEKIYALKYYSRKGDALQ